MPIIEYKCPACGHHTELIEPARDVIRLNGLPVCPMHPGSYHDMGMERIPSVPATPKCKGEGCYKKSS